MDSKDLEISSEGPQPEVDPIKLGDAARDKQDWKLAAEHYADALKTDPENASIWVQLGNMRKESGEMPLSEEAYRQALVLHPEDADIHLQMGHLYKLMDKDTQAVDAYRAALRRDPANADAFRELDSLGMRRLAEKILRRAAASASSRETLVFDVSDLVYYIGHHPHLTGIQRVQCSIILSIFQNQLYDPKAIQFISFDRFENVFRVIDRNRFLDLLEDLSLPEGSRAISFDTIQARHGCIFPLGPVATVMAKFKPTIVLLGAAWVIPDYPNAIVNLKRAFDARFVMVFHDLIPIYARETCDQGTANVFKVFIDQILDHVDQALCVSQNTAKDLARYCDAAGIEAPPTIVTQLGSGFAEFVSERAEDEESEFVPLPEGPFVLFVATIEGRKNHDYVLQLWQSMVARGRDVPRLVCVGRLGWRSENFLKSLLASDYLGGKVEIIESISDAQLDQLYADCLFTVFPSLYEGWGLPVGESLAYGKVCVLSDRASLPEVAGKHGVYIPLSDVVGATAIVEELIFDPDKLAGLETELRDTFKPIRWKAVAERVLEGCGTVRSLPPRLPYPVVKLGREYPVRSMQSYDDGLMGQDLVDSVLASHAHIIVDGVASPRTIADALAARDEHWREPERGRCRVKDSRATIEFMLDRRDLEGAEHVIFYLALDMGDETLPAKVVLSANRGQAGEKVCAVYRDEQLVTWSLPAARLLSGKPMGEDKVLARIGLRVDHGRSLGLTAPTSSLALRSFLAVRSDDIMGRLSVIENQAFENPEAPVIVAPPPPAAPLRTQLPVDAPLVTPKS